MRTVRNINMRDLECELKEYLITNQSGNIKEIIKYTLHKPEAISNDIINKFVDFGEISLSFDHQITFNE